MHNDDEKLTQFRQVMMNIKALRVISIMEGISFLLLLGVAMPLKYMWSNDMLIRPIGMAHGVLFLVFLVVLLVVCQKEKWSLSMFVMGLVASLLPFAPFLFDMKLRKLQQEK